MYKRQAKGEVKERETIVVRIEDQQGYVGYGECVAFTEPFYTFETVETCWKTLVDDYIFNLRLMRPKPLMTYVQMCIRDSSGHCGCGSSKGKS